ncbi:MCE family protein [Aeromicrobium sp.]|uniref:MCE family protein n=1 Tax=Aeromicrobium sp. TaxID=1871063 RepID=UPI0030BFB51B
MKALFDGRQLRELPAANIGLVGLTMVVLVVALALNVSNLQVLFASGQYTADFIEGGGVREGDDVRVDGVKVGSVRGVTLGEKYVEVSFTVDGVDLGDGSRAEVKSANALGRKFMAVSPGGAGKISSIPVSRTDPGYSVNTALGDLTTNNAELDVDQVAESFESLSTILAQTPEEFRSALSGVTDLSRSITKRDEALARLLQRSTRVSRVLADRNEEITAIMTDGSAVLGELQQRREVVRALLRNTEAAARQLEGLADDNAKTLKPALTQLKMAVKILEKNRDSLEFAVQNVGSFVRGLGEAVGSGPFFAAYVQNLTATNVVPILPDLLGDIEQTP